MSQLLEPILHYLASPDVYTTDNDSSTPAVMSSQNDLSQQREEPQQWMSAPTAPMSHYPPVPPPDQQHYNPLYPPQPSPNPLLEADSAVNGLYNAVQQAIFPKSESQEQPQQTSQAEANVQQPSLLAASTPPQKSNRLRKACDSCSIRKVKCDETGPPCKACAALDIPCTFDRPSRRRGPPNRHAEAIKRRRLESPGMSATSSPNSPTNAAHALAALSTHPPLSADAILPIEILDYLINDFYTYIHPICPFPHEPTFRDDFRRRKDYADRQFLALLAAMVAALVASFPRKPRQRLKMMGKAHLFPTSLALIRRCHDVVGQARGPAYLDREDLTIVDAMTSYFLGLAHAYTFRWNQSRLYMGECLTMLRSLGLHKDRSPTHIGGAMEATMDTALAALGQETGPFATIETSTDNITREMGRRVWWCLLSSVRSMQQLGADLQELYIPPPTPSVPYPLMPIEVDDQFIYSRHVEPQPAGLVSELVGFNTNCKIFNSYASLVVMELSSSLDDAFTWDKQKKILDHCLRNCKRILEDVPSELTVWPPVATFSIPEPRQPQGQWSQYPPNPSMSNEFWMQQTGSQHNGYSQQHQQGGMSGQQGPQSLDPDMNPDDRRKVQYEIQKANIYASHLGTRNYIVDKYWNLYEAHKRGQSVNSQSPEVTTTDSRDDNQFDSMEQEMISEREDIVKDLLVVLGSISQIHMEPNADSFNMKVRQIAANLLDVPKNRKSALAQQAEAYLAAFLEILIKLERGNPRSITSNSEQQTPQQQQQPQTIEQQLGSQLQGIMDAGSGGAMGGGGGGTGGGDGWGGQDVDEDSELRHWVDLREYQIKFARGGGLHGL